MFLVTDLSQAGLIRLRLVAADFECEKNIEGKNTGLLIAVDKFLRSSKVSFDVLSGVVVRVGGGGFTSVRVAVTLANAFSHVTKKPIVVVSSDEPETFTYLGDKLRRTNSKYVSAVYASAPNISRNNSLWGVVRNKNK